MAPGECLWGVGGGKLNIFFSGPKRPPSPFGEGVSMLACASQKIPSLKMLG